MSSPATRTTTPLAAGVRAGEGWHLDHPRMRRAVLRSVGGVAVLLLLAWAVWRNGHPIGAALFVPVAVAVALLPFEQWRPRVPAGLYAGDLGHGLLVPTFPMRTTTIASLAVLGATLWVVTGAAVVAVVDGRAHPGALALGLLPLGLGALFLLGAFGGLRGRRRPARGLLLTPEEIVIGNQYAPCRVAWDDVTAVRAHWTISFPTRRPLIDRGATNVDNWLTFEALGDAVDGPTPLRALSGTPDPTAKADQLAVEPEVVLATCRFYLEHPDLRGELTSRAATDRMASLAREL